MSRTGLIVTVADRTLNQLFFGADALLFGGDELFFGPAPHRSTLTGSGVLESVTVRVASDGEVLP